VSELRCGIRGTVEDVAHCGRLADLPMVANSKHANLTFQVTRMLERETNGNISVTTKVCGRGPSKPVVPFWHVLLCAKHSTGPDAAKLLGWAVWLWDVHYLPLAPSAGADGGSRAHHPLQAGWHSRRAAQTCPHRGVITLGTM
jgi:hypothetical protein